MSGRGGRGKEIQVMLFRHCFQWSFYKNIVSLSSQGLRRCIRRGPRRQGGVSWTGQRLRGVEGSRGVESSGGAVTAGDHSSGSGKNRVSIGIREANRQAGRSPLLRPPHTCKMNFQSTELHSTLCKTVSSIGHICRCICCPCIRPSIGAP